MLGFSQEELLAMPISAIHPDEMPILRAFAQSVFKHGSGWTNELTCLTKQGQKLPSEISASTIEVAGRSHIIAMIRDITERRQAEKAERDLAVVEERNRLAREIHDSLAQGLVAIIWQLNAVERPLEDCGKEALQSLESVRKLARECLQEARRSVWDLRSGPLRDLSLVEALRQESGKVAEVGIQSSFEVTGTERVLPGGVETALLRINQEALANVLKHANASRVTVNMAYQDTGVRLSIHDDGIGFDPHIPSQWHKDRGGFGIMSMRNEPNCWEGSCRSKVSWAGEPLLTRNCRLKWSAGAMTDQIRILIADDHPIVRQGLATVLEQESDLAVVGQAVNGVEAVAKARQLLPDIILMDLQMPEMDGVEAINQIMAEELKAGIIILTTYDTDDHIFRGIEAGARGYLLKDCPLEEVVKAIRTVNRGESLIEPRVASRLLDRLGQLSRGPAPESTLSRREIEVLQVMATGAANKQIANELSVGQSTVKTHIVRIFNKLGVNGRTEAVAEAVKKGIIKL